LKTSTIVELLLAFTLAMLALLYFVGRSEELGAEEESLTVSTLPATTTTEPKEFPFEVSGECVFNELLSMWQFEGDVTNSSDEALDIIVLLDMGIDEPSDLPSLTVVREVPAGATVDFTLSDFARDAGESADAGVCENPRAKKIGN
jgi:hypothetical protein